MMEYDYNPGDLVKVFTHVDSIYSYVDDGYCSTQEYVGLGIILSKEDSGIDLKVAVKRFPKKFEWVYLFKTSKKIWVRTNLLIKAY